MQQQFQQSGNNTGGYPNQNPNPNYNPQQNPGYNPAPDNQRQVSFGEAIKMGIDNFANFNGRASRSEYWWWALFAWIVQVAAMLIFTQMGSFGSVLNSIVTIAFFIPGLSIAVRRLHDINKSGWNLLWALLPIVGFILLIVWYCRKSDSNWNSYGPVPNEIK